MLEPNEIIKSFFLVSTGALFGVNFRLLIYQKLGELSIKKEFRILFINSCSSFLLGLFYSILLKIKDLSYSYQLILLFSVGFLGSMSTFSTFVFDSYQLIMANKPYVMIKFLLLSISLPLILIWIGSLVVN